MHDWITTRRSAATLTRARRGAVWSGLAPAPGCLCAAVLLAALAAGPSPAGATSHDRCPPDTAPLPAPVAQTLRSYRGDLSGPVRLAIDAADNVYVTEPARGRVVVRAPDGRIVSVAGDLGFPVSIAADSAGRILVGDGKAGTVTAYGPDWQPLFQLGAGPGEFGAPNDIGTDPVTGNIYVADSPAHVVKVYDQDGVFLQSFGGQGSAPGQFDLPAGIFVDANAAEVLVSDQRNFRVQVFALDGTFICRFGDAAGASPDSFFGRSRLLTVPSGLWVDDLGRVYVADAAEGRVRVIDRGSGTIADIGGFGAAPGEMRVPLDLAIDSHGRLFVTDSNNARLEVFGIDGFADPELFAPATVQIVPDPFDHQGGAARFEARIEVPGYRLDEIAPASIQANGVPADPSSAVIGDQDGDTVPDLTVAFDRTALAATLPPEGTARITVQGDMRTLRFDGADTIAVSGGIVDADGDGVLDNVDRCLGTAPGAAVDADGCAIAQLCLCAGPITGGPWIDHGSYVSCTSATARSFANAGLIGIAEIGGIVRAAATSMCGQ